MAEFELGPVFRQGRAALRTVFLDFPNSAPERDELRFHEAPAHPLAATLDRVFSCAIAVAEAEDEAAHRQAREILFFGVNALVALTPARPLAAALEDAFFELAADRALDLRDWLKSRGPGREQLEFYRKNLLTALTAAARLREVLPDEAPELNPAAHGCLGGASVFKETPEKIVAVAELRDPFQESRVFRYAEGAFAPVTLEGVRTPGEFCGYQGVRSKFQEHLGDFAAGRTNVPLLVSSLPGLGKTQFSIAYTLAQNNLTLILAEPEALSGELRTLIALLRRRRHRRFVVFFDDIEPEKIDWYGFRTNVGGSAMLPENILFILATNGQFPVNIVSRGREVAFPVFDEVRCMEMVEDFLLSFGLSKVNENLTAVIASSYIEDFGQKKFTELSPRTLMRYLEHYRSDGALRKRILALSQQEMIVRPDAQVFYEFNIRSLRALFGDSYIDRMREEQLKALEGQP